MMNRIFLVLSFLTLPLLSACSTTTTNNWVLDGGSSTYFETRQAIRTKIVEEWNSHLGAPSGKSNRKRCQSEVNIMLNADGEIKAFKFTQKSKFKVWNEELERAVKAAAPFGAMPAAVLNTKGLVDFSFKFYVSDKDG